MPTQFKTFDVVDATFKPQRADDLRPGLEDWIGRRSLWQCNGMADPGSAYAGQASFAPQHHARGHRLFPAAWIPECDLDIHQIVEGC